MKLIFIWKKITIIRYVINLIHTDKNMYQILPSYIMYNLKIVNIGTNFQIKGIHYIYFLMNFT